MKKEYDGFTIAGFVLSVISILFFPLSLFGLVFSIYGLKRVQKNKKSGGNLAIAGIILSGIVVLASIFLVGIFIFLLKLLLVDYDVSGNLNITASETNATKIANPASSYCLDEGNRLEIRSDSNGQYGVCISPDGKECEEWAYYRKECSF